MKKKPVNHERVLDFLTDIWLADGKQPSQFFQEVLSAYQRMRDPQEGFKQSPNTIEAAILRYQVGRVVASAEDVYDSDIVDSAEDAIASIRDGKRKEKSAARKSTMDAVFGKSNVIQLHSPDNPLVEFKMTEDQEHAWEKMVAWLKTDRPFFVLKGYAGTGKSFLMQKLHQMESGHNFYFSAPTNKATKVLSDFIGIMARTTYSLLGLRMVEDGDKKVLGQSARLPDLGHKPILVIDEAGMIPEFMADLLAEMAEKNGWRVIFVGDPAQLNPVGESRSKVWSLAPREDRTLMTEVKRFDNQILHLTLKIRQRLKDKEYRKSPIKDDNDGKEGVFVVPRKEMMRQLSAMTLADWKKTKVAAWRNKTVESYNRAIRSSLGFHEEYEPDDLIMMAAPVMRDEAIIAYTDEEFQIKSLEDRDVEIEEGTIQARAIALKGAKFSLLVPKDPSQVVEILNKRAKLASQAEDKDRKILWRRFWSLKESFHSIRYGYAMTVHRLQGTTLDNVFVDQVDILANPNEREAYRCLYVAASRPRFRLTTF